VSQSFMYVSEIIFSMLRASNSPRPSTARTWYSRSTADRRIGSHRTPFASESQEKVDRNRGMSSRRSAKTRLNLRGSGSGSERYIMAVMKNGRNPLSMKLSEVEASAKKLVIVEAFLPPREGRLLAKEGRRRSSPPPSLPSPSPSLGGSPWGRRMDDLRSVVSRSAVPASGRSSVRERRVRETEGISSRSVASIVPARSWMGVRYGGSSSRGW